MAHLSLAFALALLLPALFALEGQAPEGKKTNIGVMDLRAEGDLSSAAGILSDRLRAELFSTGKFSVMERGEMDAILKEQGFQQSGACDDKACMVEVGQLLGVERMVAGSIGMLGTVYLINLRIIEVGTGKLAATYSGECRCPIEDLGNAMKTAAEQLVSGNAPAPPREAAAAAPPVPPRRSRWAAIDPENARRWGVGLSFGVANYSPDVNKAWDFYSKIPSDLNPRYSLAGGFDKMPESMLNYGLRVTFALNRFLRLKAAYNLQKAGATPSFEFRKTLQDAALPPQGTLDASIDVSNHVSSLGLMVSRRFRRFRPYAGADFLFGNSTYGITLGGNFRGYDYTAAANANLPLEGDLHLSGGAAGFSSSAGVEFFLGRRLGLELNFNFTRFVIAEYKGKGDLSQLENLLMQNFRTPGESDYIFSQAKSPSGATYYFFAQDNWFSPLFGINDAPAGFAGGGTNIFLNFYF